MGNLAATTSDPASGIVHPRASLAAGDAKRGADGRTDARTIKRRLRVANGLLALTVLFAASIAHSESQAGQGPFARLAGSWHGSGSVVLDDGSTERLRCRATYGVWGPTMRMALTCASDAFKLSFAANAEASGPGNAIFGLWSEASHNISGSLRGRGSGDSFQVVASGGGFNADISLRTSGNKQSVTMRANSLSANISLTR